METSKQCAGRCLCGAVSLQVELSGDSVAACHCANCRKWGGGPLLAVDGRGALNIEGDEHLGVYVSSEWGERGFCRQCGTHLFFRMRSGEMHAVPVGVLDEQSSWKLDYQIFIDSKPHYYAFANETQDLTGEQVFAQHAPE